MWSLIDGLISGGSEGDTRDYLGSGKNTQKKRVTKKEAWTSARNFIWEVFFSGQLDTGNCTHKWLATECTKERSRKISHYRLRQKSKSSRHSKSSSKHSLRSLRKSTGSSFERKQYWRTSVMLLILEVSQPFQQKHWKWVTQLLMTSTKVWRCLLTTEIISTSKWHSYKVLQPWPDKSNKKSLCREQLNVSINQHSNITKCHL